MNTRHLLFHPLSPLFVLIVPLILLGSVVMMPPHLYEFYMREPNFSFMNGHLILFFVKNIIALVIGLYVVVRIMGVPDPVSDSTRSVMHPKYIWLPLCAGLAISLYAEMILLMNNPWLWSAWLTPAKDFSFIRSEVNTTGALTESGTLLAAMIQWSIWKTCLYERAHQVRLGYLRIGLIFSVGILLFSALIKLARWELFPYLTAIAISLAGAVGRLESMSFRRALPMIVMGVAGLFLVFNVIAMIRGVSSINDLIESSMGYTMASFNRLALMLSGALDYPYGGTGIYAFRFLANVPVIGWFIDVTYLLGIPDAYLAWLSEFDAVAASGLSRYYIWATAFGYIYSDLGDWVYLYAFAIGVLSAWGWREFWQGNTMGIVLYPYLAFCLAFIVGDNFVAYRGIVTLVMAGAALVVYERVVCEK